MQCTWTTPKMLCDAVPGKRMNVSQALALQDGGNAQLAASLGFSAFAKSQVYQGYVTYEQWKDGSDFNNVQAFIDEKIFRNDHFLSTCKDASLAEIDLTSFKNNLFIFSLSNDSVVSPNNSAMVGEVNNMTVKYFNNTLHQVCDGGIPVFVDHIRGELIANIFSRNFIGGFADGINVSALITKKSNKQKKQKPYETEL